MTSISHGSGSATAPLLRGLLWRLAGRPPDNLVMVLALSAIPTLFLLWLVARQIRESESADTPQVRRM